MFQRDSSFRCDGFLDWTKTIGFLVMFASLVVDGGQLNGNTRVLAWIGAAFGLGALVAQRGLAWARRRRDASD